jgi:periplasmic copper chaperone A
MSTCRSTCVPLSRIAGGAAIAVAAALAFGGPSLSAHIGTDMDEVAAGASTTLTFSIGHGCEESPTTSMRFQIPESVLNAAPVVKPGWSIEVEKQELSTPVDAGHGGQQTERTSTITFTAHEGSAVENGFRDNFTLAFAAPDDEGRLFFKVIQGCTEGETAWIDEWDGTGDEPEHPAPSIMVVAATADEGSDGAGVATQTDDDDSKGLAIVALVVGALGLAVGAAAIFRGRASTRG